MPTRHRVEADRTTQLLQRHRERLRAIAHSAGWPCHDAVELDLLAAGLIRRVADAQGRETLQVVDRLALQSVAGTEESAPVLEERAAITQSLVNLLLRAGRLVWCDLEVDGVVCDVYSVRNTSIEDYLQPSVHVIRTRQTDWATQALDPAMLDRCLRASSHCWCVLGPEVTWSGAAEAQLPSVVGVMRAVPQAGGAARFALEVARPASRRTVRLPVPVWMSLARSAPVPAQASPDGSAQALLGAASSPGPNRAEVPLT